MSTANWNGWRPEPDNWPVSVRKLPTRSVSTPNLSMHLKGTDSAEIITRGENPVERSLPHSVAVNSTFTEDSSLPSPIRQQTRQMELAYREMMKRIQEDAYHEFFTPTRTRSRLQEDIQRLQASLTRATLTSATHTFSRTTSGRFTGGASHTSRGADNSPGSENPGNYSGHGGGTPSSSNNSSGGSSTSGGGGGGGADPPDGGGPPGFGGGGPPGGPPGGDGGDGDDGGGGGPPGGPPGGGGGGGGVGGAPGGGAQADGAPPAAPVERPKMGYILEVNGMTYIKM